MRNSISLFSVIISAFFASAIGGVLYLNHVPAEGAITVSVFLFAGVFVLSYGHENKNALYMACGKISRGQSASCTIIPTAGTEVYCWLMNRDDVDKTLSQFDGTNTLILTDLIMKAGKFVYKFEGYKNSVDPEVNMNKGRLLNNWAHGPVRLILIPNSPDGKTSITEIAKSNLVAIVANKQSGLTGNQKFEVYGWGVGLEMAAGKRKQTDAETQGMWDITLNSPEGEFEPFVPYTLWDTDEATTLAQIVALQETT